MKATEVLARLDAAWELISAFPPDIDILTAEIGEGQPDSIQIYDGWQKLIDNHMIDPAAVRTNIPHGGRWAKEVSVHMKGFDLFQLTDKKEAALSVNSTEYDNESELDYEYRLET